MQIGNGSGRPPGPGRPLPALELEVMKVLWSSENESSVRDVQEALEPERPLAYTTVMTLLDRLARKGAVSRRKQSRSYLYSPVLRRDSAADRAVNRLVRDFFRNSRGELVAYLQANPESVQEPLPADRDIDSALL